MNTRIKLVHCDTLSCEPILRRAPDGGLLCVSQCGDVSEPAPGNRMYGFRSEDNGETWNNLGSLYPETGEAVYGTEVMVTDFPGSYCYPDGFYEEGHILFTIEINRHEILFFDSQV